MKDSLLSQIPRQAQDLTQGIWDQGTKVTIFIFFLGPGRALILYEVCVYVCVFVHACVTEDRWIVCTWEWMSIWVFLCEWMCVTVVCKLGRGVCTWVCGCVYMNKCINGVWEPMCICTCVNMMCECEDMWINVCVCVSVCEHGQDCVCMRKCVRVEWEKSHLILLGH
jgi:hypothetical protein